MLQIRLVADEHDHCVRIGMVLQLLQPSLQLLERVHVADVVHEQGPDGTAVVGRSDGPVALLARRVPDLGLEHLTVNLDRFRGRKLDPDCGLGLEVELVLGEAAEDVGLAHAALAYCEKEEEEERVRRGGGGESR